MKIQIEIKKNQYGSMFAFCDCRELFQFEERGLDGGLGKGKWYFWPRGNYDPEVFAGKFPREYFDSLCRASWFIRFGKDTMPDDVVIVEGEKLIKGK